jgi:hypothetical protein
MKFMTLPSDIQSQLTPDEKVIQYGAIIEGVLYVTNKRVFYRGLNTKNKIESIAYRDIVSIDPTSFNRQIVWVIIGIAILLGTFLSVQFFRIELSDIAYVIISVVSIVMIIVGFYKVPSYVININGKQPIKISARNINSLIYDIRKNRERTLSTS